MSNVVRLKSRRLSKGGFLLPVVIAVGLGVSTVSVLALQTVAQNSQTLNMQSYSSLAIEAAQAGIAAAANCIKGGTVGWSDASPLTPATDCTGKIVAGRPVTIADDPSYKSTYSVKSLQTVSSTTSVVNATGTVSIKGPGGIIIGSISKTARTFAKTGGPVSRPADEIATGPASTCVTAQGQLYCWGDNTYSQLGTGKTYTGNYSAQPQQVPFSQTALSGFGVTAVSIGLRHACAVANAQAYCWGTNGRGELGNNSLTTSTTPVAVDTSASSALNGKTVVDVQAGQFFSCALTSDGIVACWGANEYGQLGAGDRTDSKVPRAVSTDLASALNGRTVKQLARFNNNQHVCAIRSDDNAVCWGRNYAGQVGNDRSNQTIKAPNLSITTTADVLKPTLVYTGGASNGKAASGLQNKTVKSLDVFDEYTSAIGSDGRAYWWGGYSGLNYIILFANERVYDTVGRPIGPIYNGTYTNYDGGFYGYRFNTYGKSGICFVNGVYTTICNNWTTSLDNKQIQLMSGNPQGGTFCSLSGVDLYCDGSYSGTLNTGGYDFSQYDFGQIGDNSPICVIFSVGGQQCTKKFGTGSDSDAPPGPVHVYQDGGLLGKTITALSSSTSTAVIGTTNDPTATNDGGQFSCVIASKVVYCWGRNDKGQLGDGTTTNRNAPTAVSVDLGSALGSGGGTTYNAFDNPVGF